MRKPRKEWTPGDTSTMKRLHAIGCTDDGIAGTTGHALFTVWEHRSALGLAPNYRHTFSDFASIPALSRRAIAAACGRMAA